MNRSQYLSPPGYHNGLVRYSLEDAFSGLNISSSSSDFHRGLGYQQPATPGLIGVGDGYYALPLQGNAELEGFPRVESGLNGQIEDLRGRLVSLAKDREGCKLLQKRIESMSEEEIDFVLSDVIDYISDLVQNHFGNYFIQKLVKACNQDQRTRIILSLTKNHLQLISICLNPHGSRAVQRLLECVTSTRQISLVTSALCPGTVLLATDPNGHHVIQHCFQYFSNEDTVYLLNEMAKHCFDVATNKSGCCVLQICVEQSTGQYRDRIVAAIIANAVHLAEDPYGNYVVQHLLGLNVPAITETLLRHLHGHYFSLSCNKYGSNVVEKCVKLEDQSSRVVIELLSCPSISMLLVDPYGNFVIQAALKVSKGIVLNRLVNLIRENIPFMRTNLYGKKVLGALSKLKLLVKW